MSVILPGLPARIAARIEPQLNGCWWWTGHLHPAGYGSTNVKGKSWMVHRLVYATVHGPIPAKMYVGHACHDRAANAGLCTDPKVCLHRQCCNPDHLILQTHRENQMSSPLTAMSKHSRQTHCIRGHLFDEKNTRYRRSRWDRPTMSLERECRRCSVETERARRDAADPGRVERRERRERRKRDATTNAAFREVYRKVRSA